MNRITAGVGLGAALLTAVLLPTTTSAAASPTVTAPAAVTPAPWHPTRLSHVGDARQLIVVNAANWSTSYATLRRYEKTAGVWRQVGGGLPARIGRSGFTRAAGRVQGSGESPAGTFTITQTFGAFQQPAMKMPYLKFDGDDFWPYDPRDPETYNVLQTNRSPNADWRNDGNWSERFVDYGSVYHFGAVINFNAPTWTYFNARTGQREAAPRARANTARGGGIFLHASSSRSTAGCVSVDYWETRRIIRWLDAGKKPRIVMAPTSWLNNA